MDVALTVTIADRFQSRPLLFAAPQIVAIRNY